MIAPLSSAVPNFKGIYQSREFMEPAQIEVANKINEILISEKYQNDEKTDIFIRQPAKPYTSPLDEQRVIVTMTYNYTNVFGERNGRRDIVEVGSFTNENVETFSEKFQKAYQETNTDNTEKYINYIALAVSTITLLATLGKTMIGKIISML